MFQVLQGGVGSSAVWVNRQLGGTASLTAISVNIANSNISESLAINYSNCAATQYDNPKTDAVEHDNVVLNGSMTMSLSSTGSTIGGNVTLALKGRVNFGGAFDDFIDADVKETVDWAAPATGG